MPFNKFPIEKQEKKCWLRLTKILIFHLDDCVFAKCSSVHFGELCDSLSLSSELSYIVI